MYLFLCFLFINLALGAKGEERCCPEVGCFSDDPPFSHLPVPRCPEDLSIRMRYFSPSDREGRIIDRDNIPTIGENERLVFIIHGWGGSGLFNFFPRMSQALLDRGESVVTVNWNSVGWYPIPASETRAVGAEVALVSRRMVQAGAARGNLWCIGHSLGAHACGHAGKAFKLGRITGLDPARRLFEGHPEGAHLNPADAALVDVMHTNAYGAGFVANIGHIDFYPNGGSMMAGCNDNNCSHQVTLDYMIESITSECPFSVSMECRDYNDLPGSCNVCRGGVCQYMGYRADTMPGRGIFYLTTNPRVPFCLG